MWILYDSLYILYIIFNNSLKCSHPCCISIDSPPTELLKGYTQITINYILIFFVYLTKQRLIIILCIKFWRNHIESHKSIS